MAAVNPVQLQIKDTQGDALRMKLIGLLTIVHMILKSLAIK
jgi:hypothetical protein